MIIIREALGPDGQKTWTAGFDWPPNGGNASAPRRRHISSQFLFGTDHEVVIIEHNGQEYRLRRTRNGKLILNK